MFSPRSVKVERRRLNKGELPDIHRRLGKRMLTDSLPALATQPSMRQVVMGIYSNQSASDLGIGSLLMSEYLPAVRTVCGHDKLFALSVGDYELS